MQANQNITHHINGKQTWGSAYLHKRNTLNNTDEWNYSPTLYDIIIMCEWYQNNVS